MLKCSLSKDINKCPFCDKDKMECKNEANNKCSFQYNDVNQKEKYLRKERWYEKYYKNK